jgi:O-antigen/teichoic acid export membrane protein
MNTTAAPVAPRSSIGATFLRNVTSNWAGIVVGVVTSLILAPITVRALGNVHYGIWTLLMQFTGYLWLFDFGVRESVVKYVAQYHAADDRDQLVSTVQCAVSLYGLVALAALAATVGLAYALPYAFNIPATEVTTARVTALLTGATIALGFVFNVFVGVLMGLQKFYVMARLGILFSVVRAVVIYVLLTTGYGLITLAVTQLIVTVISNMFVYYFCVRDLPYLRVRPVLPGRMGSLRLLHYGKYVLIANVGDKIVFATDSIVIGMFLPISALTFYAIGGSLIEQLRGFIASMGAIFNPLSSSLEARKESSTLSSVFISGAKGAMAIGLPVCLGFIFLGRTFIDLWMGPEYGPSAGAVLAVLTVGHLLGLPYYTIAGVLYGLGRHRVVAITRVIEGAANLALSIVLVRRLGLVGVAIGTVIPHILVVGLVLPWTIPRYLNVSMREYYVSVYGRPLVSAVPFALACWAIAARVQPQNLWMFALAVAAALLVYVIPCWLIALTPVERGRFLAVLRRFVPVPRPAQAGTV